MGVDKQKFGSVLAISILVASMLAITILYTGTAFSMGLAGPFGGFCLEADTMEGEDFEMVTREGVTTAQGEQPLIQADIGNAEVQELTFYKDLPVPEDLTEYDISGARFYFDVGGTEAEPLEVGDARITFSHMDTNFVRLENAEVYESGGFYSERLQQDMEEERLEFRADYGELDQARARAHAMSVGQIQAQDITFAVHLLGEGLTMECYSGPGIAPDGPDVGSNQDHWIERTEFNRLDHRSGQSTYGYQDLTFRGTDVAPGGEYELVTTAGMTESRDHYGAAWMDWDQDSNVSSDESYPLGSCDDDGCTLAKVVDVPEDAPDGQALLRVAHQGGEEVTDTDLEEGVDEGEILDYAIDYGVANRLQYDGVSAEDGDEYVSRVRFGNEFRFSGIDDETGPPGDTGYQDRTEEVGHVGFAEQVPLAVDVEGGGEETYVSVWIDWNRNNFLEDWERYDLGSCESPCKVGERVDVPTFSEGGPTLMRVAATTGGYADEPRGELGEGNVLDYTVGINDAYADSEDHDFVFADNRDTWISGVELNDLDDHHSRQDVVDFNWAWPDCRDQGVTELDSYFYPDSSISSSDDDFHEDDGGGVSGYTPAGECFLRTDADAYTTIFSDPGADDDEQDSELPHYPERGERIEYRHYVHNDGNDYGDFYFGRQDSDNYYLVRLDDTNTPSLALHRSVDGTEEVIAEATPDVPDGEFHEIEIDWGTGYEDVDTIEVTLTNGADRSETTTIRANDDSFDDGGIGFGKANDGTVSYAHLWDRVTVDGTTRAEVFDRVELFGLRGHEDRTYERTDVARGEEPEMTVTAEGADGTEVHATAFFDWNRNDFLGPDIATAFRFLDDFEYGDPEDVPNEPRELVENFADTDDPEYVPVNVDDFGQSDDPYERGIVDYNWELGEGDTVDVCDDDASQDALMDYYYPASQIDSDEDDQWSVESGDGGDQPDVDECVLFTEGADWDGDANWIWSLPDGDNDESLSYYPGPGDTITIQEAYFRSTDLMFMFGAESEDEFYGVYSETDDASSSSPTITTELRKYTGGIGGSYTTLASDSFEPDDEHWIDRDDGAIWTVEVDWHSVTDGEIDVEYINPDGDTEALLVGSDSEYGEGGVGHWSDTGSHSSFGVTYSNAAFVVDAIASGEGCSIDGDAYSGDTADFASQEDVTTATSECALEGDVVDSGVYSLAGLDSYPERGERIRYDYQAADASSEGALLFGNSDAENGYAVVVSASDDEVSLERWEGGGQLEIESASAAISSGDWYEVEVDWGGPDETDEIQVTLRDSDGDELTSFVGEEGRHDDGGIGFAHLDGAASYWDEVEKQEPRLFERFEYEDERVTEDFGAADEFFESNVVDFNWAYDDTGECVDEEVYRLDEFFDGDMSSSDDDFHEDDGEGATPAVPEEECYLRSDADGDGSDNSPPELDGATITSMPDEQDTDLPYYPTRGDNFTISDHYWHQSGDTGPESHTFFGVQDHDDGTPQTGYAFHVFAGSNEIALEKWENGDQVERETTAVNTEDFDEEFHDIEIEWGTDANPDRIRATFFRNDGTQHEVTMEDGDWDDGGVGFHKAQTGGFGTGSFAMLWGRMDAAGFGCVLGDGYTGDRDAFQVQESVTYGDSDCALTSIDGGSSIYSTSDDGDWDDYPEQGDRINYMFRGDGAGELSFGVQDEGELGDDRYRVRVNPDNDELRLDKFSDGNDELLAFTSAVPLENDEWHEIRVDWGTEITVSAHDPDDGTEIGSVTATDVEFQEGGVGFGQETGGDNDVYWDGVRLENRFGVCSLSHYDGNTGSSPGDWEAREFADLDRTCQLGSNASDTAIWTTDGLEGEAERGDNIRFDYWVEDPDIHSKFRFGVQDQNNYYAVNLTDKIHGFQLLKYEGGDRTVLDQANFTGEVESDREEGAPGSVFDLGGPADYPRHDVNIQWGGLQPGADNVSDETISVRIFQYDSTQWMGDWFPVHLEANDSTFDDGGIGFEKSDVEGSYAYYDDVRVDNCDTYGYRGDREHIFGQPDVVASGRCALKAGPDATDDSLSTFGDRGGREGVDEFAQRGDTIRFDYRYERPQDDEGAVGQFFFGPNPSRGGDTYGLQIHPEADEAQFQLFVLECAEIAECPDTGDPLQVSTDIDLRPDEWYTIEVGWGRAGDEDPEIVARAFGSEGQVADVSLENDWYDEGDIGFRKVHGEGTSIYFDDVRVFEGESRADLGSCVIEDDECRITDEIEVPQGAQGGSVLMRTILTEDGPALGPYDDVGEGEVVDHTLNVDTASEPTPDEAFAVTVDDTNSPVEEGEILTVTADIENTKNETETQDVVFEVPDGTQRDSTSVTLDPGDLTSVTLEWDTEVGDEGEYTAWVYSEDDGDSVDVELTGAEAYAESEGDASQEWIESHSFSDLQHTSGQGEPDGYQDFTTEVATVDQGSGYTLEVTAATDSPDTTQYVSAWFDWNQDYDLDSRYDVGVCEPDEDQGDYYTCTVETTVDVPVGAEPGETRFRTIQEFDQWPSSPYQDDFFGQTVDYTADVQDVEFEDATFDVSIDDTNTPVVEDEDLEVTATVENTGEEPGEQYVTLDIPDGTERDNRSIQLDGGDSTTQTWTWTTEDGDAGDYDAWIHSDNDSDSTPVTVDESATFEVTITSYDEEVEEGELFEAIATVENTGDVAGTKDVELWVDEDQKDVEPDVELDPGDDTSVTLEWQTGSGDAGDYTALVGTEDDSDTREFSVLEGPFFDVTITDTNSPVEAGETMTFTTEVENTGGSTGTGDVVLDIDVDQDGGWTQEDVEETVTLDAGQSDTITLEWSTSSDDVGFADARASAEDSDTGDSWGEDVVEDVEVEESAFFDVTIDNTNEPVTETNDLNVDATVENTGGQGDTQDIELWIDSDQDGGWSLEDTEENVELEPDESTDVTLTYTTEEGDYPEIDIEVRSDDDEDGQPVEIFETRLIDDFDTGENQRPIATFNWDSGCDDTELENRFFGGISDGDLHLDDGSGLDDQSPDEPCYLRGHNDPWNYATSMLEAGDWGDQSFELPYYGYRGDDIEFQHYTHNSGGDENPQTRTFFGVQDADPDTGEVIDGYALRIFVGDDEGIELEKLAGGDVVATDRTEFGIPTGEFHDVRIEWGTFGDDSEWIDAFYTVDGTEHQVYISDDEWDYGGVGHGQLGDGTITTYSQFWDRTDAHNIACSFDRDAYDEGNNNFFRSQDAIVQTGSCALHGMDEDREMFSFGGLDDYPQRGDKIRYYARNHDFDEFRFGAQTVNDHYAIQLRQDWILIYEDGEMEEWDDIDVDPDQWFEVIVDWGATENDEIHVELYYADDDPETDEPIGEFTYTSTAYDDGGIGYQKAGETDNAYWDDVRVETSR